MIEQLMASNEVWMVETFELLSAAARQQLVGQLADALSVAASDIDQLRLKIASGARRSSLTKSKNRHLGGFELCVENWLEMSFNRVVEQWRSDVTAMVELIRSTELPTGDGRGARFHVDEVELWLSDRHSSRTVTKFVTDQGKAFVCKFRRAHCEAILDEYSRILNDAGIKPIFYIPPWIESEEGSIHEYVEEHIFAGDEVFNSIGRLLAQMFFIRGTDFHAENVRLAPNGLFAIIDAETIFCPAVNGSSSYSLNDTGIPPYFMSLSNHKSVDIGFLTSFAREGRLGCVQVDQFCRGFEDEIVALSRNAKEICASIEKHVFENSYRVRLILRPTQFYSELIRLVKYENIVGVPNITAFRTLQEVRDLGFSHRLAEVAALSRGDIPKFEVDAVSGGVMADGTPVGVLPSPVSTWKEFVQNIVNGREHYANILAEHTRSAYGISAPAIHDGSGAPEIVAHRIAALLLESFLRACELGYWHSTVPAPDNRYSLRTDDFGLYSGWAGVAMFLRAYGSTFEHAESTAAALEICRMICRKGTRFGGLAAGAVGSLYAIGVVLRIDPQSMEPKDASTLIDTSASLDWQGATSLDMLGGLPGVVCVLSSLPTCFHSLNGFLPNMHRLGSMLVDLAGRPDTLPMLSGISHGLAGVSLALAQYGKRRRDPLISMLIKSIFDLENSQCRFDGWPDLRGARTYRILHQWCHGSVGVGISRLASVASGDGVEIKARADLLKSIDHVVRASPNDKLNYCCGEMGRIDFLIECADKLARPEFLDEARGRWKNAFSTTPALDFAPNSPFLNVGLFRGFSGVGWVALRLLLKGRLPFVGGVG